MLDKRVHQVKARIQAACELAGRSPQEVTLMAASKQRSPDEINAVYLAGVRHFGENYLQEALPKCEALSHLSIVWHFIGPIQSNKTRKIAENFSWVHSIDRCDVAKRLSSQRPETLGPLNVCLQVNISDEPTKSGVSVNELAPLLTTVSTLPRLTLRGLMVIPKPVNTVAQQEAIYCQVQTLYNGLQQEGWPVDTLSMGMSSDLEAAIKYGATIVRIGESIFGKRENK